MKLMSEKEWKKGHRLYLQAKEDNRRDLFPAKIIFERLENGSYANVDKKHRLIIFPERFLPLAGYEYTCKVYHTKTGVFVHKGISYRVRRAYLDMTYEEYVALHRSSQDDGKPSTLGDLLNAAVAAKK